MMSLMRKWRKLMNLTLSHHLSTNLNNHYANSVMSNVFPTEQDFAPFARSKTRAIARLTDLRVLRSDKNAVNCKSY